jgi:hypothetical protein
MFQSKVIHVFLAPNLQSKQPSPLLNVDILSKFDLSENLRFLVV